MLVAFLEHRVEHGCLRDGAREAIKKDAVLGVRLVEAGADHAHHEVVGDEPAGVHDRLGLTAERGVPSHLVAQHVPRRDVWDSAAQRDPRCLGALAAAGRSEHQGDHLMNPLYWRISSWVSICFMVSSATPTTMRMAVPPRYRLVDGTPVRMAVSRGSTTVMSARKSAPASVILPMTLPRYSAVLLPGRMPGMNVDWFFRLSATSTGSNTIAV